MTLVTATQYGYAYSPMAAEQGGGSGFTPLLLLLGLGVFTYFILVRPQRNRMKQLHQTQATLIPGAEVMTTAGLYATVVDFDDDSVTLETAPGVHNRYARAAVARIITPVDDALVDADEVATDEGAEDDDETPDGAARPER